MTTTQEDEVRIWDPEKYVELQKWLGLREGGTKYIDPYYVRKGMGNKAYCWDDFSKKWRILSPGDTVFKRADGTVGHEKRAR